MMGGGGSDACEGYEGNQADQEDERNPTEGKLSKQKHKEGFHYDSSVLPLVQTSLRPHS